MIKTARLVLALALLLLPLPALAQSQTVTASFTASTDHHAVFGGQSVLTGYELEHRGTEGPTTLTPLGKPVPAANGTITVVVPNITLTPNVAYTFRVAAVGPGGKTFSLPTTFTPTMPAPGAPGPVTIVITITVQ